MLLFLVSGIVTWGALTILEEVVAWIREWRRERRGPGDA